MNWSKPNELNEPELVQLVELSGLSRMNWSALNEPEWVQLAELAILDQTNWGKPNETE